MMILFVIVCVIVLSSLSYRRPRYGWSYYNRPLFFGAYRHHRPMRHMHMGPHFHHGPRGMHGPMGGPRR